MVLAIVVLVAIVGVLIVTELEDRARLAEQTRSLERTLDVVGSR